MKKVLLLTILFLAIGVSYGQPTGNVNPLDTANYPHWIQMMQDHSINFHQTQRAFNLYWANRTPSKGTGFKQFKRWEAFWATRVDENGNFPNPDRDIIAYKAFYGPQGSPKLSGSGSWTALGPIALPNNGTGQPNGLGRVNCVAFDPTNSNTIFIGAPAGGLWKSTNGGNSWTNLTDNLPSLGVSSILIDSANTSIMYIGTGDRDAGDSPGIGVYKTTNGGSTWTAMNSGMGNKTVGMMVMNPGNHNIILAATSGGIYRTTNAGSSWTRVSSNTNHYKDIKFHPSNPSIVYAVRSNAFYRSTNGGTSWTQVSSGLPTSARFVIGVSAASPNTVYLVGGNSSGLTGIYRSTNSGQSFSTQASSPNLLGYDATGTDNNSQAWYDLCVAVDPSNANTLYVGGVNIWKSTNGGLTWAINAHWVGTSSPAIHADQHWLGFNPLDNKLYSGNDGGVYYTANGGSSWIDKSSGLAIGQVYKIGQSQQSQNLVINGYQDNGTAIYNGTSWSTEIGGDGFECAIDPTSDTYMYGALYYGDIRRSTNGGTSFASIADNGTNGITESGAWVTPYTLQEGNPNTMFIGYKNVWRSTNVKANGSSSVIWTKISTFGNSSNLSVIASSKANNSILYAARGSSLFRCSNANAASPSWTTLNGPGSITDIETNPNNSNIVYVTAGTNIYKSVNGGSTWTSIKGNLPTTSMNTLIIDTTSNEGIYVGTDIGVYYKDASMSSWVSFSSGLPPAAKITELDIYYGSGTTSRLRAASFGRGLWSSDLYSNPLAPPVADFSASNTTPCVGQSITLTDLSTNAPTSWEWTISPGNFTYNTGSTANSQNPSVYFTTAGSYTIKLKAINSYGADSITKITYISVGTPISAPMAENFESFTQGNPGTFANGWSFSNTGIFNWRVNSGNTNTTASGPNVDHTVGTSTGKYLYTEASSPASQGEVTNLISPCIAIPTGSNYQFSFWYHMYGNNITALNVDIFHNGSWTNNVYTINGQQQSSSSSSWLKATFSAASYAGSTINVRFRVVRGSSYNGDVAIDDFSIGNANVPSSNFSASTTSAYVNSTVNFADLSLNTPTSWAWSFTPNTVSYVNSTTSSSQNPQVSFTAAGNYSVQLITSNSYGSDTLIKYNYINVINGQSLPFTENFETFTVGNPGSLNHGWTSATVNNFIWRVNSGGTASNYTGPSVDHTFGTSSGKYLYTEASGTANNSEAHLMTPLISLSSVSNAELKFWYHMYGAGITALNVDIYSNNTWTNIYTLSGQQQSSHTQAWQQATVNLLTYVGQQVKIRFRVVSSGDYRNDVSIDDILVQQVVPPANDDPCGAISLNVGSSCSYQIYNNLNATSTTGVGIPSCGNYNGGDVWFKTVVPTSGYVTIDFDPVTGSFTDGAMAVYKGSCGSLTYIDCNDDYNGNGTMPHLALTNLTGGDTLFIRIWRFNGGNGGNFKVCLQEPPYVAISPTTKTVGSALGSTTFQVNSNQSWTISDNASWLVLSPQSGTGSQTVTASYSANAGSPRNATLTVSPTSGGSNATAILTQYSSVVADFTISSSYLCLNTSTSFTNTSVNQSTNQWFIDGVAVSTATNLSHSFTTEGQHSIKLKITGNNLSDSISKNVFVAANPTVNAGIDTSLCEDLNISWSGLSYNSVVRCTSNCTMPSYCVSKSNNDNFEFIQKVSLNGASYSSSNAGNGYEDHSTNVFNMLYKDSTYNLYITGHVNGNTAYTEYVDAFIDWNHNGLFDEPAISMGSYNFTGDHIFNGIVSVPANAVLGKTKMRVILKYNAQIVSGCETNFNYGETEDYQIEIVGIGSPSYTWSGPNSFTSTSLTTSISNITTAASGNYVLTATNGFNCSANDTKVITVNAAPNASFTSISPVCIDANAFALTQGSPSGGTYSGPGVSNGTFNPSVAGSGVHTLKYSVSNSSGCSDTASINITVNALPTVSFSTPAPACDGTGNISLSGGLPAGGTYAGSYVSNGVFNSTTAGVGSHSISYTYTDANNCTNSASANQVILASPNVTMSSINAICLNSSPIALSAGSPSGGSYTGTGVSNNLFNPAVSGSGTFQIQYTYTNANNCSDSAVGNITVNALPNVSLASLSAVCEQSTAFALNGGSPSGGNYSGSGVNNGQFNPSIGAGSYPITYTYTDGNNCSDTAIRYQVVNPLPTVHFTGLPSSICSNGAAVNLQASPLGGSFSGSGISGNTFTPSTAGIGNHQIIYSYTNASNCTNADTQNIAVQSLPVVNAGLDQSINYSMTASLSGSVTGSGTYTYSWSPSSMLTSPNSLTTNTTSLTATQIFTLTAMDNSSNCSDSDQVMVVVLGGPLSASINASTTTACQGDSITLTALASGGTGTYTYGWYLNNTLINNQSVLHTATSQSSYYKIVITDGVNSVSDSIWISVKAKPNVSFANPPNFCEGDLAITLTGGYPLGGSYSGIGVNNGQFDPSIAGVGLHQIVYSYTDSNNCSNQSSVNLQVFAKPNVSLNNFADLCLNTGSITLSGGLPQGGMYSGNGVSNGSFNPTAAGVGTHAILYVFIDNNNCGDSATANISVQSPPIVNAGSDQSISTGSAASLTGSVSGGSGNFSYNWMPSNLVVNSGNLSTNTVALTSSQEFTLHASDINTSCSDSDKVLISISGGTLSLILKANDSNICVGESVQLTALASGGSGNFTYSWSSNPSGFSASTYNPIFNPSISTMIYLNLSDGSNQIQDSLYIQVAPVPLVNLGNDSVLCDFGTLVLDAGSGPYNYLWNDGSQAQTLSINTAMLSVGSHSYWVDVSSPGGCSASDTITYIKGSKPYINLGPDKTICKNKSIVLDAGFGFQHYLWNTGDTTQTIYLIGNVLGIGTHDIWAEVMSPTSCSSRDSIVLTVDACPGFADNKQELQYKIYPNPSKGKISLKIESPTPTPLSIALFDLRGSRISTRNESLDHRSKTIEFDFGNLSKGVYLMRIQGDYFIHTERIIIQ